MQPANLDGLEPSPVEVEPAQAEIGSSRTGGSGKMLRKFCFSNFDDVFRLHQLINTISKFQTLIVSI